MGFGTCVFFLLPSGQVVLAPTVLGLAFKQWLPSTSERLRPGATKKEGGIRWTPPFAFRAAKLTPVLGVFATCIIAGLPAAPGLRLSPGVCFSPSSQVGSSVASCRPYILSAGSCPSLS